MDRKTDAQILYELEKRPDARTRNRTSCEKCGSKDHVKKSGKKFLCPDCRKRSGKKQK